jgi:hypothetical protein
MRSRIWRLAGVGLLCVSVTAQSLADQSQNRGPDSGQHEDGGHQGPGGNNPPRPHNGQQPNQHNGQNPNQNNGQWQSRPAPDYNSRVRSPPPPPQLPANDLPIQPRPDTVQQTQQPRRGDYRDEPRRNDSSAHWNGYTGAPSSDDHHWQGRPSGRGDGWGPGPQYRPGHVIERFPDREYRVPYGGRDYYYAGGYWYRPQGPRYVVVQPPRGIRVQYLPDYAREVWIGGSLLFMAAGSYYAYQQNTQDYRVVEPPGQPLATGNGYDVEAYPANGQSLEQVNQDGYDCYRWAVEQSGFDPRVDTWQPDPAVVQAYRQAQGGCLGSRGYRVTF